MLSLQCTRNGESQLLQEESRLCPSVQDTTKPDLFQTSGEHPSPYGVSAGKALLPHLAGTCPPPLTHTPTPGRSEESPRVSSAPAQRGKFSFFPSVVLQIASQLTSNHSLGEQYLKAKQPCL